MRAARLLPLALVAAFLSAQVSSDRILHANSEPQNWLTYGGGYASNRYSLLTKLNRDNVKDLKLKWVWRPRYTEKMEATPLVVDGVLYTVQNSEAVAMDAATGRIFWTFHYTVPPASNQYLMVVKGLAISGNSVFWATYDGHLISIDAKTGIANWNKTIFDWHQGYQFNTAPLVVKDKIIIGPATNEEGANCWVAAFDAKTGNEVWRFYTAPTSADQPEAKTWAGESWKHGGSPIWVTGSYDPESNLTFWGTGNPNAGWNGDNRAGDNLYSDCVIALDADTGKLKWHYQFTPHDELDWDSVQVPVLAEINWQGQPRKVVLWANRNGFFYVIDRTTGKFLLGKAFVKQNWNIGFDEAGRPMKSPARFRSRWADRTSNPARRAAPTGIRPPSARAPGCSTFPPGTTTADRPPRAISRNGSRAASIAAMPGRRRRPVDAQRPDVARPDAERAAAAAASPAPARAPKKKGSAPSAPSIP